MKELILVTGNQDKLAEFERMLGVPITAQQIELPEIQDTDVASVAKTKAQMAYQQIKKPLFVDDSGLFIHAWGNLPGALAFWFQDNVGNEGVLKMLTGFEDRSAHVETVLGYCDENGPQLFLGKCAGTIVEAPRGTNGLGFDAIFMPDGTIKTQAEMTAQEKDAVSARHLAVNKLHEFLNSSKD
jgi:XTP/dITP diphosphohydrolase